MILRMANITELFTAIQITANIRWRSQISCSYQKLFLFPVYKRHFVFTVNIIYLCRAYIIRVLGAPKNIGRMYINKNCKQCI